MSEISCANCKPVSACCQGGTIELTLDEASFMLRAGNILRTIAQPENYDREDVFCPSASVVDDENPTHLRLIGVSHPLAAGLGRYWMLKPCVNLELTDDGGQQCSVYDKRPGTCRRFEMGGSQCVVLRQTLGVDPMTEATEKVVAMLNEAFTRAEQ